MRMENQSRKARSLLLFLLVIGRSVCGFASDPPLPQPVAILDTTELLPNQRDPTFTTVAFSSDTIIEVVACPSVRRDATCPSAVFSWKNGVLGHVAQVARLDGNSSSSSADGKRLLLDFNNRDVSRLQHLGDDIRAVTTFGMIYPEDVNREVVQVVDILSRKSCFDWRRTFPATYSRTRSAAISPSGEFVGIKVGNNLSVYRLPSVCKGPRVTRRK
jgi:hypothetical protein